MLEIAIAIGGIIASIIGFYIKRLYREIDSVKNDMKVMREELTNHRVDGAARYLPREEMKEFADRIRQDVQSNLQPLFVKLQSIEEYLRKSPH